RYFCAAARTSFGAPPCQGLAARALDDEVVRLALEALTPAALEVSLRVAADLQGQIDLAEGQWRQKLERARFEAERARRQYGAGEPPRGPHVGGGLGAEAAGPPRVGRAARAIPQGAAPRPQPR